MSMSMIMPMIMISEIKTTKSPMMILIITLMLSWILSINLIMQGMDQWSILFLIMLFNGGLMITYLFVISMLPKEKKNQSQIFMKQIIIMYMMMSVISFKTEKTFFEMFNLSMWIIMFLTMVISIVMTFVFLIIMDPFKTIKSSF